VAKSKLKGDNMVVQIPPNYMNIFSELVEEQYLNIDYLY